VLAWHLGERGIEDTEAFTEKLREATSGRFQLTTVGWRPYENAVSYSLGTRVDYAMLIKVHAKDREGEQKVFATRSGGNSNEDHDRRSRSEPHLYKYCRTLKPFDSHECPQINSINECLF